MNYITLKTIKTKNNSSKKSDESLIKLTIKQICTDRTNKNQL